MPIDDLTEGDYIHSEETGEVYRVVEENVEWDEENDIFSGTVTLEDITTDNRWTEDAKEVDFLLHDHTYHLVSDTIIEEPERVLLEFAGEELGNYLDRLGHNHDYNGIDGVSKLRDIQAAQMLRAASDT